MFNNIKKLLMGFALLVLIFGLVACNDDNEANEPVVEDQTQEETPADTTDDAEVEVEAEGPLVGATQLRLSFNQSIDNPQAQTVLYLSDNLYRATEGRYSIEIFPNEQLGNQADSLALVQAGALDMAIVANPLVENIEPDFAILGAPFVYDSIDHQLRILLSGDLDPLFETTQAAGFYVLAAYNLGPRNVYLRDGLIETPEDLDGQSIRVMQSDTMVEMMRLMGGIGTPMPQGEVYTAIQTGILDGAENNIITYLDLLQYEVAPYYIETNHLMIPDMLVINNSVLAGMSAEDQAAFRALSRDSIQFMFDAAEALREDYRAQLIERGVTFGTVDMSLFRDRVAPLIDEVANRTDMSREVYEIINSHR